MSLQAKEWETPLWKPFLNQPALTHAQLASPSLPLLKLLDNLPFCLFLPFLAITLNLPGWRMAIKKREGAHARSGQKGSQATLCSCPLED